MHQHFAQPPADHQLGENHLGVGVEVPAVMGRELIRPDERAVAGPARQHAVGPLVLARALLGVVGTGIAGAEVDQVELRIVGDPAPHRRAAAPPRIAAPGRHADVGIADVAASTGARQHQRIGAHVVRRPEDLPGREIESLHPPVDPELATRRAHDHAIARDERRHRRRLALTDVGDLRLP